MSLVDLRNEANFKATFVSLFDRKARVLEELNEMNKAIKMVEDNSLYDTEISDAMKVEFDALKDFVIKTIG